MPKRRLAGFTVQFEKISRLAIQKMGTTKQSDSYLIQLPNPMPRGVATNLVQQLRQFWAALEAARVSGEIVSFPQLQDLVSLSALLSAKAVQKSEGSSEYYVWILHQAQMAATSALSQALGEVPGLLEPGLSPSQPPTAQAHVVAALRVDKSLQEEALSELFPSAGVSSGVSGAGPVSIPVKEVK